MSRFFEYMYDVNNSGQDTQTMKLKKWVMVKHFEGFPKDSDFELVEEDIPELQDGGKVK